MTTANRARWLVIGGSVVAEVWESDWASLGLDEDRDADSCSVAFSGGDLGLRSNSTGAALSAFVGGFVVLNGFDQSDLLQTLTTAVADERRVEVA